MAGKLGGKCSKRKKKRLCRGESVNTLFVALKCVLDLLLKTLSLRYIIKTIMFPSSYNYIPNA